MSTQVHQSRNDGVWHPWQQTPPPPPSAGKPLVGCTVFSSDYPNVSGRIAAASLFDSYVGRRMAMAVQKQYFKEGEWPASVSGDVAALAGAGIKIIMCFKPSRALDPSEQNNLAAACAMYSNAGIQYEVILWQECNAAGLGFFSSGADYIAYMQYYRPFVPAGVKVIYDAAGSAYGPDQESYFPAGLVDAVYVDTYAGQWIGGKDLSIIEGVADNAKLPFGIGEFGLDVDGKHLPTPDQWNQYVGYLQSLFAGRQQNRLPIGDVLYYGGTNATDTPWNVVTGPTDYKVPALRRLYDQLRG